MRQSFAERSSGYYGWGKLRKTSSEFHMKQVTEKQVGNYQSIMATWRALQTPLEVSNNSKHSTTLEERTKNDRLSVRQGYATH